ncbi:dienelactone hydrolase family protein [Halofilum ochraceum]|uniref:dienelactone hydrolase family protein n=1 Tax=Halofilum ochraceum TaxID=1611323 RepID=UPI0008DAC6D5|nr:dienelactone hydrolase family protein [Halofilum ochraceum]
MQRICQIVPQLLALALVFTLIPAHAEDSDYGERVAEEHADDTPSANIEADQETVHAETRDYATLDGEPVSGYLARPRTGSGPFPAVVLIHEWWGLNDNIRAMARRFADAGYVALAVDLYEGETAQRPKRARTLMDKAMARTDRLERNIEQAFYYLDVMPSTARIGSVGWCFGGGWSLRTALMFPEELDASVIYYGELETDADRLAPLDVPILGLFGSEDSVVPTETVREFGQVLTQLEKPHEIHVYEGAGHAFANPSGENYEPDTAARAWAETTAFLNRYLKGAADGSGASTSE